jgi:hypothetical protein
MDAFVKAPALEGLRFLPQVKDQGPDLRADAVRELEARGWTWYRIAQELGFRPHRMPALERLCVEHLRRDHARTELPIGTRRTGGETWPFGSRRVPAAFRPVGKSGEHRPARDVTVGRCS